MSSDLLSLGSPDPFLASQDDVDVDAEGSNSHTWHQTFSVDVPQQHGKADTRAQDRIHTTETDKSPQRKRLRVEHETEGDAISGLVLIESEASNSVLELPVLRGAHDGPVQTEKPLLSANEEVTPMGGCACLNTRDATRSEKQQKQQQEPQEQQDPPPQALAPLPIVTSVTATTAAIPPGTAARGDHNADDEEGAGELGRLSHAQALTSTARHIWSLLTDAYAKAIEAGEGDARRQSDEKASSQKLPLPPRSRAEQELSCVTQHSFAFLLTNAFHVALWYVLRYAGPSVPPSDLVAARTLVTISAPLLATVERDLERQSQSKNENDTGADDGANSTRTQLEAAELLIRLALRKPCSFTRERLEAQYGDQLHVRRALSFLADYPWDGEPPHATESEKKTDATGSAAPQYTHTLLQHYDGARVSALLSQLHPIALQYRDGTAPDAAVSASEVVNETEAGRELLELLYAVRVRELRALAFALYYHYHPTAAASSSSPLASVRPSVVLGGDGEDNEAESETVAGEARTARGRAAHAGSRTRSAAHRSTRPRTSGETATAAAAAAAGASTSTAPEGGATSTTTTAASSLIPTRKRDTLQYLIEQRFRDDLDPTAGTATAAPEAVEAVVATYWQLYIGPLYTVPRGLKHSVHTLVELFHALTGNFGAGGALATMATSGGGLAAAATPSLAVAVPPSMLLVRPQMLFMIAHARHQLARAMLMRRLHASVPFSNTSSRINGTPPARTALPPWWWWSSSPSSATLASSSSSSSLYTLPNGQRDRHHRREICLFPTPKALSDYQAALHAHQELYLLTDAPASAPAKQQLRDKALVLSWYESALATIHALKQGQRTTPCAPDASGHSVRVQPRSQPATIHEALQRYGLFAHHLLQFTALYRWFSYLELLVPPLQSGHFYAEANVCLRILTEEPLYTLLPQERTGATASSAVAVDRKGSPSRPRRTTAASAAATAAALKLAAFHFYYRPEKHGEWRHRLALNLSHLRQQQDAIQVLEDAHTSWHALWAACQAPASTAGVTAASPNSSTTHSAHAGKTKKAATKPTLKGTSTTSAAGGGDTSRPTPEAMRALLVYAERLADRLRPCRSAEVMLPFQALPHSEPDDAALLAQLPPAVQRRCRLLRSTFPLSHDMAAYHAVMESLLPCYCRRCDRLLQEKTLKRLYHSQRRWTPFPDAYQAFTASIEPVPVTSFAGCRDAMDPTLWCAPHTHNRPTTAHKKHKREAGSHDDGAETAEEAGRGSTHDGSSAAPAGVEDFVMRVCLETWNACPAPVPQPTSLKRSRSSMSTVAVVEEQTVNTGTGASRWGPWRGAHCEGMWIALAARALLWDCYNYPFTSPADTQETHTATNASASSVWPTAGQRDKHPSGDADPYYLWLSPFQEGPLDVLSTTQFTLSRRRLIEDRLAYLESCSKEALLDYVKARIRNDSSSTHHVPTVVNGKNKKSAAPPEKQDDEEAEAHNAQHSVSPSSDDGDALIAAVNEEHDDEDDDEDDEEDDDEDDEALLLSDISGLLTPPSVSLLEVEQDASVVVCFSQPVSAAQPPPSSQHGEAQRDAFTVPSGSSSEGSPTSVHQALHKLTEEIEQSEIADHLRVDVAGFPLLDLLHAVPQRSLLRLLRHIYLGALRDGYGVKFSGFPDLVLWRSRATEPGAHLAAAAALDEAESAATFRLIEVKSPSDVLSTKQMVINDCLQRCGFCVEVGKVVEVKEREDGPRGSVNSARAALKRPLSTSTRRDGVQKKPATTTSHGSRHLSAEQSSSRVSAPKSGSSSSQEVVVL